eukprot:361420-Chlamydomonas_euryale.AAC.2
MPPIRAWSPPAAGVKTKTTCRLLLATGWHPPQRSTVNVSSILAPPPLLPRFLMIRAAFLAMYLIIPFPFPQAYLLGHVPGRQTPPPLNELIRPFVRCKAAKARSKKETARC